MTDSVSNIEEALKRWQSCQDGWGEIYQAAREDQTFYAGQQWEEDVTVTRAGRPSLVTSHLQQFVHHVANNLRMNPPAVKVHPADDATDIAKAKVVQGLIKSIETVSKAGISYNSASENSIISSFGWIRVDHDYISPDKFEQHILIKDVANPLSVWIDPNSVMPDGSDAKFGFVMDTITLEEFKANWPEADPVSFGEKKEAKDNITVAEYFCLQSEIVEIGLLQSGEVVETANHQGPFLKTRTMEKTTVLRQKLSGVEVLEETKFPGSYIPLVPVFGEIRWVDGKRVILSLIRNAKDSQRMINYYNSLMVESLSKAPQAPFVGVAGQFEGFEEEWQNPHKAMVLQYNHMDINGQAAPAPQRLMPPTMPTGAYEAKLAAIEEMKAAMGLNASNMGQQDNSSSGLAIDKRQKQGETAVAHFGDNRDISVAHVGHIILSMMPEIYDTTRVERIINDEDESMKVVIGQGTEFDINSGKYDLTIEAGASFSTRREEAYQNLMNILQTWPEGMGVIGDLIFKYSDMPGAEVISERLKKMLPPNLQEQQQDPEKMEMAAQLQELSKQLQMAQAELEDKKLEHDIKLQEIDLKRQELANRGKEIKVNAYQAQYGTPATESKPPLDVEAEGMEMKTPDQIALDDAAAQRENDINSVESQLKMAELQLDQQEMQQREAIAAAQQEQLNNITLLLAKLNENLTKPKQVVRDPVTGMIQGITQVTGVIN